MSNRMDARANRQLGGAGAPQPLPGANSLAAGGHRVVQRPSSLYYVMPRGPVGTPLHQSPVTKMLLDPGDPDIIFTASRDSTIRKWDVREKAPQLCYMLAEHTHWVNDAALIPHDTNDILLSCSSDKMVKVWNVPKPSYITRGEENMCTHSGKTVQQSSGIPSRGADYRSDCAVVNRSPAGQQLLHSSSAYFSLPSPDEVDKQDLSSGAQHKSTVESHAENLTDGGQKRKGAGGGRTRDAQQSLWSVSTTAADESRSTDQQLPCHAPYTNSPGAVESSFHSQCCGLPPCYSAVNSFHFHNDYCLCLAYAHTTPSQVAVGGLDGVICVFDLERACSKLNLQPHGRVNTTSHSRGRFTQTASFKPDLVSRDNSIWCVDINSSGTLLVAGGSTSNVVAYSLAEGNLVFSLGGHTDVVKQVAVNAERTKMVSVSSDKKVKAWDLRIQKCLHTYTVHSDSVWALANSLDTSDIFYTGGRDGRIFLHSFKDGSSELIGSSAAPVVSLALSADEGSLWSSSMDSNVYRWAACKEDSKHSGRGVRNGRRVRKNKSAAGASSSDSSSSSSANGLDADARRVDHGPSVVERNRRHHAADHHTACAAGDTCTATAASSGDQRVTGRASPDASTAATPGNVFKHSALNYKILGVPKLCEVKILNTQLHALTRDINGYVQLWNVLRGEVLFDFGTVNMEEKLRELQDMCWIPQWFNCDVILGSLRISLESTTWFRAEIVDSELPTALDAPSTPSSSALQTRESDVSAPVNLGELVVKTLFHNWAALKRQNSDESSAIPSRTAGRLSLCPSFPPATLVVTLDPRLSSTSSVFDSPTLEASRLARPVVRFLGQIGDELKDEWLPKFVVDCVLLDIVPDIPDSITQVQFTLAPAPGSDVPPLSGLSNRLTARRSTKIIKVMQFVLSHASYEFEQPNGTSGSTRSSQCSIRRSKPSRDQGSPHQPLPSSQGDLDDDTSISGKRRAELYIVLSCRDVPLENWSLGAVKEHIWKSDGPVEIRYGARLRSSVSACSSKSSTRRKLFNLPKLPALPGHHSTTGQFQASNVSSPFSRIKRRSTASSQNSPPPSAAPSSGWGARRGKKRVDDSRGSVESRVLSRGVSGSSCGGDRPGRSSRDTMATSDSTPDMTSTTATTNRRFSVSSFRPR